MLNSDETLRAASVAAGAPASLLANIPFPQGISWPTARPLSPRPAQFRLEFDDGTCSVVSGSGSIGHDPVPPVAAPAACTIHVGARRLRVRPVCGRAVIGAATVEWGAATRVGTAHRDNQDAYCAAAPVFVVADGIGGHAAGELASGAVVAALLALAGRVDVTSAMFVKCLADVRARLGAIRVGRTAAGQHPQRRIVTHDVDGHPQWMVVNLGDSRTYRVNDDGLRQITVDHSLAQELIDAGVVKPPKSGPSPSATV